MNVSVKGPNAAFAALPLSGRSGLAETRGYSRRTDRKAERRALRARRRTLASDVHHRDNALSSSNVRGRGTQREMRIRQAAVSAISITDGRIGRSEEHTSELQSLMRNSYAVFCLKKKNKISHTRMNTI